MKRFVLFIAALSLLAGCSSNSPVAPGDTIYNITGGATVFKVGLSDYPLVLDSIYTNGDIQHCFAHIDIPFTLSKDTTCSILYRPIAVETSTDAYLSQAPVQEPKNVLLVDDSLKYKTAGNLSDIQWDVWRNCTVDFSIYGNLYLKQSTFRYELRLECCVGIDTLGVHVYKSKPEVISILTEVKNKSCFTVVVTKLIYYAS